MGNSNKQAARQQPGPGLYSSPSSLPPGSLEIRLTVYKLPYISAFGGYHSGVVIGNREWSYGGGGDSDDSGVYWCVPEKNTAYTFKKRIIMGVVDHDKMKNMETIIARLQTEWRARDYILLERNCNHFSSTLLMELVGKPSPSFVNELAESLMIANVQKKCRDLEERRRDEEAKVEWQRRRRRKKREEEVEEVVVEKEGEGEVEGVGEGVKETGQEEQEEQEEKKQITAEATGRMEERMEDRKKRFAMELGGRIRRRRLKEETEVDRCGDDDVFKRMFWQEEHRKMVDGEERRMEGTSSNVTT